MVQQQQMQLAQLQQQANVVHHQRGVCQHSAAAQTQPGLIDTLTLGKPEIFKGDANEFADWQFIFTSCMTCVNPLFAELLERVEASKVPVPNRFLKENEGTMSSQLYFVLVMLERNRALDIAYNAGVAEGLEAYRRLHQQITQRWLHAMLEASVPFWQQSLEVTSRRSLKVLIRW